jgi:hypothetical protein
VGDGHGRLSLRKGGRLRRGSVWPDEGTVTTRRGLVVVMVRLWVMLVLLRLEMLMGHVIGNLGGDQARRGQIGDTAHVHVGVGDAVGGRSCSSNVVCSRRSGSGGTSPVWRERWRRWIRRAVRLRRLLRLRVLQLVRRRIGMISRRRWMIR